jgi:hypothetical protein
MTSSIIIIIIRHDIIGRERGASRAQALAHLIE